MTHPPAASIQSRPLVQYRSVLVCDQDTNPPEDAPPPDRTQIAQAGSNGLVLISRGNDFYPLVELRYWDASPVPPDGDWEESQQFTVEFPNGVISVCLLLGGTVGESIQVPAGTYAIKAYRRGDPSSSFTADMPSGPTVDVIEAWVIDFWPAQPLHA